MLTIAALLAAGLTGGTWIYTQHPKFGKLPDRARLDTIKRSPNYSGDGFQNLIPTPVLADDRSFVSVGVRHLFAKKDRSVPPSPIPSFKTDLQSLDRNRDVFVWLGHSSYSIQLGGKRIMFDPVFSASVGPVPYLTKAFDGTNPYTADDLPEIDYLLITHDHWDHLDYATVTALRAKTKTVVCGLGVGAHLERWGYDKAKIHEAENAGVDCQHLALRLQEAGAFEIPNLASQTDFKSGLSATCGMKYFCNVFATRILSWKKDGSSRM